MRKLLRTRYRLSSPKEFMILVKKLSSKQVLEVIRDVIEESMPDDAEGELFLQWTDQDEVEVFFTQKDLDSPEQLN